MRPLCAASWFLKAALRRSWQIIATSCSPTRCLRTCSPRVVVDRRSRPMWWRRSWCSRPSRDCPIGTPLGPCGTGLAGRWPADWPSMTRGSTSRSSRIGAPGCASPTSPSGSSMRSALSSTPPGCLKGKTRRALDSTLLDDAVATQDTVTQLIAAIRRVRRVVPGAMHVALSAHDYDSAGKPLISLGRPSGEGRPGRRAGHRCPDPARRL